jgi:hypothetical protein
LEHTSETQTVTVSISMQQPVTFQIPRFVNIGGTIFKITRAIFEKQTDAEPSSFNIEFASGEPGNVVHYGIPINRRGEATGKISAAKLAQAIYEAEHKPPAPRDERKSVFCARHN